MIGTVLGGRYDLRSHLARGGMAEVFDAQDNLLGRRVAVKVLHSSYSRDAAFVQRFRREAQAAANLSHPNIVSIYDTGEDNGTHFIVMELVEGRSLRDVLKREGHLLPRRAAEIAAEVAAALAVAHRAGLVHRDIKPGNVLLTADGSVKVTDFGIARAWDDSEQLTRTGAVIGTATYFSPEQAQGRPADERSDIYALGVVLYEMLAGLPPFSGENPVSIAYQHVSQNPIRPSVHNPDVPADLDAIVMRALDKEPLRRYPKAEAMRADLLTFLSGSPIRPRVDPAASTRLMPATPPPSVPPDETYRHIAVPEYEARSQWPLLLTVVGLLLLLAVGLFGLSRLLNRSEPAKTYQLLDFRDQSQAVAERALADEGITTDINNEASSEIAEGSVIRTDPPAGATVREGETVILFVSTGPELFSVPGVTGREQASARSALERAGFTVETSEEPSDTVPAGFVASQEPVGGQDVAPGSIVRLVVSTGPAKIILAEYANFEERDALIALTRLGLEVDSAEEFSETFPDGVVIRTDPPAGTEIQKGGKILLVISKGPTPVTVPDLLGNNEEEARAAVLAAGLQFQVGLPVPVDADSGLEGTVVEQTPTALTPAPPDTIVTVRIGVIPASTTTTTTTVPATTTSAPS